MAAAIRTDTAPIPAYGYSQAIRAGEVVYTAGFGPHDPGTGKVVGDDISSQTGQVMRNLSAVLAAAGTDWAHVVKVTAHLQELKRDFVEFDTTYRSYFSGGPLPARTTVGSTLYDILVEIDVVATVP